MTARAEVTPQLAWLEYCAWVGMSPQRHALAGHLDRVRVAQLMWREPAPDAYGDREVAKLLWTALT